MDLVKGTYQRNDDYINILSPGEDEEFVEIGQFSRNYRYRYGNDNNTLFLL